MKPYTDIQELLERYWEGETTLEEERRLRQFFAEEPVPEQLKQEAAWFHALRTEQAIELPGKKTVPITPGLYRFRWAAAASVALLLMAGAGWWLSHTAPSELPVAPVAVTEKPSAPRQSPAPLTESPDRIADSTAKENIAVVKKSKKVRTRKLRTRQPGTPIQPKSPDLVQEDTEHAVAEIKAALELISAKINKGKKEIGKGLHEVETLDKIIKKKSDG